MLQKFLKKSVSLEDFVKTFINQITPDYVVNVRSQIEEKELR